VSLEEAARAGKIVARPATVQYLCIVPDKETARVSGKCRLE
jgi:hypothetical protein